VPDAFYPLTLSLTIDPVAISAAITAGGRGPKGVGIGPFLLFGGAAIAGLIGSAAVGRLFIGIQGSSFPAKQKS
jgi:hypothetical protein